MLPLFQRREARRRGVRDTYHICQYIVFETILIKLYFETDRNCVYKHNADITKFLSFLTYLLLLDQLALISRTYSDHSITITNFGLIADRNGWSLWNSYTFCLQCTPYFYSDNSAIVQHNQAKAGIRLTRPCGRDRGARILSKRVILGCSQRLAWRLRHSARIRGSAHCS